MLIVHKGAHIPCQTGLILTLTSFRPFLIVSLPYSVHQQTAASGEQEGEPSSSTCLVWHTRPDCLQPRLFSTAHFPRYHGSKGLLFPLSAAHPAASPPPPPPGRRHCPHLGADHIELAVLLQLELDGLLPKGFAQRHHHHRGGLAGLRRR